MRRYKSKYTGAKIDEAVGRANEYGLGISIPPEAQDSDANNIYKNGWYRAGKNVPKNGYWYILQISHADNYATQIAFGINRTSIILDGTVCKRYKVEGAWSAWEYINPPMSFNVEYRTTERYQGKPVYVKLVKFGILPNATAKAVNFSIENNAQLVDCKGFLAGEGVLPYSYPGSSVGTANVYTNKSTGSFGVTIITDKDLSGKSAYFILEYTKTTD